MDTTENRTGTDSTAPEPGTAAPFSGPSSYSDPVSFADTAPTSAVVAAGPPPREHRRFTLRRSRTDVWLGGVCGGLASELDVDPALVRVSTVAVTLFTGGGLALVYLAAWILAPREKLAVV
ncbi:phage shock protein C (PspC) family protein [Pseudonocardia sediminis]|uniref:Phage shock protein C (PspC) family protein n=1 Tax=Pseudonocardia sediminis TaxID=1397368 RepID=A0A4Q7V7B2_PSEST|nr:PspC domain-containing protein [Pseudonocardia sediminis]RZT88693.1 phage shock protein C (PspC) family protein [Pseudonocardia sediminis]